jgi:hypothetical protein
MAAAAGKIIVQQKGSGVTRSAGVAAAFFKDYSRFQV